MQTAREYLAAKNLAQAGARGKFSKAAHAELKRALDSGITFSDWDKNGRIKPTSTRVIKRKTTITAERDVLSADAPIQRKPVRKENAIKVVDNHDHTIIMDMCDKNHPIQFCVCRKIMPKAYLNAKSFELIERN